MARIQSQGGRLHLGKRHSISELGEARVRRGSEPYLALVFVLVFVLFCFQMDSSAPELSLLSQLVYA